MKNIKLTHELTPPELVELNRDLAALLENTELQDDQLRKLIEQRDDLIQAHLASLEEDERKRFAEAELPVNDRLNASIQKMLKESVSQLSSLMRGLKAVKKYK